MVLAALVNMVAPAARIAPSRVASQRVAQALRVPAFRPRVAFHAARTVSAKYASEKKGDYPSMDFRIFFSEDGKAISPWHNVPLHNADGTVNFICEIPKETKAKMEVATDEELTPIKQDTKKGKLRDYPYNINWNYGMIPQTWEDPNHEHPTMKVMGDNDPVDVVEIGAAALPMGSISPVKPVGVYAMIDDGELDWKVVAVAIDDPLAKEYNDIDDVPEAVKAGIREWFRWYKTPDDKPLNGFGFDEKYLNAAEAEEVIAETHESWKKLKAGDSEAGKLWLA